MKAFEKSAAIILAAGQGKRMQSKIAKVLHPLGGMPMILHVLNLVERFPFEKVVVVVGNPADAVLKVLSGRSVTPVLQPIPRGTGDAVRTAEPLFNNFTGSVLILNGDTPLLSSDTLLSLWEADRKEGAPLTLLTADRADPAGYGRILRKKNGEIDRIVEEKDTTDKERQILEINAGVYLARSHFLWEVLRHLSNKNRQQEYYLTDLVKMANRRGERVSWVKGTEEEVVGVNSLADLSEAEKILQQRLSRRFMEAGVTFMDPARTRIELSVTIGPDTVLYPGVMLQGNTSIGEGSLLYPCRITDSIIGPGVIIKDQCVIEGAIIESGVSVGPFAHLRPGTILRKGARVGNFVEVKQSELGEASKANHLAYLGDASIGKRVNIGAGTITCNFDGEKKHKTVIGDDVFVGSDTQFIAPVTIGARSWIAAGSTITKDVESGALAIARARQEIIPRWKRRKAE